MRTSTATLPPNDGARHRIRREKLGATPADVAKGGRALLRCEGVDAAYGKVQVLFGVDLDVQEHEIVALLGTNGAGKSTLLNAISGLVDPTGGEIVFDGQDITHADGVVTANLGIVQVPGGKAVFPRLTVTEHFTAGTWLFKHEGPAEIGRRIDRVLEQFPWLRDRWTQMAGNLSGGEQQQLALGMAFVARPRLLIVDELSLGLAPRVVGQLLEMVRAIHDEGCTIMLVEQSVNVALNIASRAYFMEKGEVRFSGPTAALLRRDDLLRPVLLQGATRGVTGVRPARRKQTLRTHGRVGQAAAGSRPVLEVCGLRRRFGGISAVDDVNLTLREHEILGLIGPNGAGKTTIFDLISGYLRLDKGQIRLGQLDVTHWPAHRRAAAGLGRSFQDAQLFPSLTVAENVALGLERHLAVRSHLAAMLNLPAMVASEIDVGDRVNDLIELMNLGPYSEAFVAELSTGTRRVVELATILAHDPTVLLLDEPSSGLAQAEAERLGPLLVRIREETGCALLVIEHDMPLITAISDEIVALDLGKVIAQGAPAKVMRDRRVVASYLGHSARSATLR